MKTSTTERIQESAWLEPEGGGEARRLTVSFLIRREIVSRPGLPPAAGRTEGRGTVLAADGAHLREGFLLSGPR